MKIIETGLEGLKVLELPKFSDERGFFMERFNLNRFESLGLNTKILQVNHSFSTKGVLRGLHFQTNPWQAKVVGCIGGSVVDVVVDIRPKSPTFGKHFAIELDCPEKMLYIPHGFAHGFEVISDSAHLLYFTDSHFNKESDNGIHYASCGINWQTKNPLISEKDALLKTFEEYKNNNLA